MEKHLVELEHQILRDSENCNPDTPEMVYDCVELSTLLKTKNEQLSNLARAIYKAQSGMLDLSQLWERYYELLIFLEGNLVILGSCADITPDNTGIYFFESCATHREKNRIARRCIHQIGPMKKAIKNAMQAEEKKASNSCPSEF